MADQTSFRTNIKRYRHLLAATVALGLMVASWFIYYYVATDKTASETTKTFWVTLSAVCTSLASTVIAFWFASVFFAREDEGEFKSVIRTAVAEAMSAPSNLEQVRWAELIDNASEIDFVVQGWNGWAEQANIARALTAFFERGGIFRLYVCNPNSDAASRQRSYMEQRLGRTPASVVEEINGTYRSISDARDQVRGPGKAASKLEVYHVDTLNWYFAAFFKGTRGQPDPARARDVFVFSIYSHTGRRPWDMPVALVYPDLQRGTLEWFEKELDHLRPTINQSVTAAGQPASGHKESPT